MPSVKKSKKATPVQVDRQEVDRQPWRKGLVEAKDFDEDLVKQIYYGDLLPTGFDSQLLATLEETGYLENYLWPNFQESSNCAHLMSLVIIWLERVWSKIQEDPWNFFQDAPNGAFSCLVKRSLQLLVATSAEDAMSDNISELSILEKSKLLNFQAVMFQRIEKDFIRTEYLPLVSMLCWFSLSKPRLELALESNLELKKSWKKLEKKIAKISSSEDKGQIERAKFHQTYLFNLLDHFCCIVSSPLPDDIKTSQQIVDFGERFLSFLIDLLSQLPTRRYFKTLLEDYHVAIICKVATESTFRNCKRFEDLLQKLIFYQHFEMDDYTGEPLRPVDSLNQRTEMVSKLRRVAFAKFPQELMDLALSCGSDIVENNGVLLRKWLSNLSSDSLHQFCEELGFRTKDIRDQYFSDAILLEAIMLRYSQRIRQSEILDQRPVYPNEIEIFESAIAKVPHSTVIENQRPCFPIPKLNLQFLTLHDYLLRNYELYRTEAVYEIKADIEDAVRRLQPRWIADSMHGFESSTAFEGWSRMAIPLNSYSLVNVGKPRLGEQKPSFVHADARYDIGKYTMSIKNEWESIRKGETVFLLACYPKEQKLASTGNEEKTFRDLYGLKYVRGAEVVDFIGLEGRPLNEEVKKIRDEEGVTIRTLRLALDVRQYQLDLHYDDELDPNSCINILLRRSGKENNFRAVLETIRTIMNEEETGVAEKVIPEWLHNIFLGYGDPGYAHYSQISKNVNPEAEEIVDFRDTFLDLTHLRESFPDHDIIPEDSQVELPSEPPFVLRFGPEEKIKVGTYTIPLKGPYAVDFPKKNNVRFTPAQVEAIRAGTNEGLSLVLGPPGTGKTDVAVQIVSNLYHNYPDQKILLVTHSNQALNNLFEKIVNLDIDERHLLRLGHGEEDLNTSENFSKAGRVNSFLEKRIDLLREVDRLAASVQVRGDHGATCETAGYFYQYHVVPRWEIFSQYAEEQIKENVNGADLAQLFPFMIFFGDAPQPLFPADLDAAGVLEKAKLCFCHIEHLFRELEQVRAFELLRTSYDRSNYLLTNEAKIVAMTCTHASLKRNEFIKLDFNYHSLVMEESGQILELETLIPMLLQKQCHLKRVVLIGDHYQLPPIVKNNILQWHSNMDQSMFSRFIRLGVPVVQLDKQGRCRSSMADLFRWRYKNLGDLPRVLSASEFQQKNKGFGFNFQMIDVVDYAGEGESEPSPHYLQNLGEAEYVVAVYQYMRLLGYPAEKITVLTMYNGQRALIEDVLKERCGWHSYFGRPGIITTVDKYQGQQNDYVLCSLVRTKSLGHVRDIRRMIVAVSRARFGFYLFCRHALVVTCAELRPIIQSLLKATELQRNLVLDRDGETRIIQDVTEMGKLVYQISQERLAAGELGPVGDDEGDHRDVDSGISSGDESN